MRFSEFSKYLSLALKLILIISIINSVYYQLWHLMSTSVFLLLLLLIPQIVKKGYKIKIPVEFEISLFLFVIISLIFGKIGGVITPLFFGIATSFIGFMIMLMLYSNNQIKKNYFMIIFFSFNFAVAFGFGIEFLKYYLKLLLGQEIDVGHYYFSMRNMTYVIIGAAFASVIGFLYMKEKKGIIGKIVRRFQKINPEIFSKNDSPEEIIELIKKGEDEKTEFKSTLRVNLYTGEIDKKIEYAALKTISAFLNSKGGTLLLGISNDGKITGLEKDRFENSDKLNLHLINMIKEKIGKNYLDVIDIQTIIIEEKTLVKVECLESKTPVFLKIPSGEEEFYIRIGPASVQIKGSELVDYINKKFNGKET
jgi:hypothetical protein